MKVSRKKIFRATIVLVFCTLLAEGMARYWLGLGDPPLSVAHPTIEYLYCPNQDVMRFGNRIKINEYGMRSASFPKHKSGRELRILVFGDSVVNGGSLTDHSKLGTTLLQNRLAAETDSLVTVANISAGSWGPGNWLAYAEEYGFFDADIVVLILSSGDCCDNPTFLPLDETTHPTKKPLCALSEGLISYLPRYLPSVKSSRSTSDSVDAISTEAFDRESRIGLRDLRSFLHLAKSTTPNVLVFQHWEASEIASGSAHRGNGLIRNVCEEFSIEPHSLRSYFEKSSKMGQNPYRDNIHPNLRGQELLDEAISDHLPFRAPRETIDSTDE